MSPDGEAIVTGAGDETLRFWNVFSKSHSNRVSVLISVVNNSVVSRQVFGRTTQIETWFEKRRRVETGFETTQNLIHNSK